MKMINLLFPKVAAWSRIDFERWSTVNIQFLHPCMLKMLRSLLHFYYISLIEF